MARVRSLQCVIADAKMVVIVASIEDMLGRERSGKKYVTKLVMQEIAEALGITDIESLTVVGLEAAILSAEVQEPQAPAPPEPQPDAEEQDDGGIQQETWHCIIHSKDPAHPVLQHTMTRRVQRRRWKVAEREHVWGRTGGICYLCSEWLPLKSPWHIEHVLAFSEDPAAHDVMGNLLPACAKCNAKKGDRPLDWCVRHEAHFSISSRVALSPPLSMSPNVKAALLQSLRLKRELRAVKSSATQEDWIRYADEIIMGPTADIEEALLELSSEFGQYIDHNRLTVRTAYITL